MQKKLTTLLGMALVATCAFAQSELFKPYKQTALRLPAVPIVVNDPYFSIWSPYDRLNDGNTRLWTNDEKPLEGLLRVDGTTYRFMGDKEHKVFKAIAPMSDEAAWEGKYTEAHQTDGWQKPDFAATGWQTGRAAFGNAGDNIRTGWSKEHSDIYIRREINLTADDLRGDLYAIYSHDDACELYINGTQVATGRMDAVFNESVRLTGQQKQLLHEGRNVMALHVYNNAGGAYADFGLYTNVGIETSTIKTAVQKSVDVMATSTYYTFNCGPVALDVVFTSPMLIDDLDLLSTPVSYVSYQVKSLDRKKHDVQFALLASPLIATNKPHQPTESSVVTENGVKYLKTGTIDQPILAKKGDGIGIDWGYLYLAETNGKVSLDTYNNTIASFTSKGNLAKGQQLIRAYKQIDMPVLAYVHDFGKIDQQPQSSYALVGYDEIEDIEYMYHRYKAYWAHNGKVSIFDAFNKLNRNYLDIMQRCQAMDKQIYDDALNAGDVQYAEILSGVYRHVLAAHKLFEDNEGNLLYFSKENNSNGCVNTVDLTYPSAPLFLKYNPSLQKAMMTSIFEYSRSGRWTKPFAAHDLGTYPIANGQVYGGDMPIEEAGNMLTLAAQLSIQDGNIEYVKPYWDILTQWTDYLVENGQDPSNQLCTDDFAGHWPHNCNLSVKAIMGVAGYAIMARMKGDAATADRYMNRARQMAKKWEADAREGDHYKLAFDRQNTWSQKYNMIWDKLWNTNLFGDEVMQRELNYYLKQQNTYGLPLDIRKDYTKTDWIMWSASMANDKDTFLKFVAPIYKYMNETGSRVPTSDWHDTKTNLMIGFKARSVVGGYWMRLLVK
jgi:hypothetical protein